VKKSLILFFCILIPINKLNGSDSPIDRKYLLGAAAIGMVAIPAYWYLQQYRLSADYQRRMNILIGNNKAFKAFVERYSPPLDLYNQWITQEQQIANYRTQFIKLKDFVIKGRNISRIINVARIKNYLKDKKYVMVDVPKKYIFLADNTWMIIAQEIHKTKEKISIDVEQIKELADLVNEFMFSDFEGSNIIMGEDGKLYLIDIEDKSFEPSRFLFSSDDRLCSNKIGILRQLRSYLKGAMTEPAEQWLNDYIESVKQRYRNSEQLCSTIFDRTDLDDDDIDTAAVKEYVEQLEASQSKK